MSIWQKGEPKGLLASLLGGFEKFFGVKTKDEQDYMAWEHKDIPKKIMQSVHSAYKRMEPLRKASLEAEKQFIGQIQGMDEAAKKPIPLNKIYQMVRIWMRLLAPTNPQVIVSTEYQDLKPFADKMRLAINRQMKELRINEIIYRAVLDAMFGYGVVKTGLAEGEDTFEIDGNTAEVGKPYSANININNFVIDMEANSIDEINFIGDRFRMPEVWAKKFLEKEKASNKPSEEMRPEERVTGKYEEKDDIYAEAWFWEIYLPKQNVLMLFLDGKQEPLMVSEWDGPERGPYQILGFDWAPNEVMPVPPTRALLPLHNFINNLLRKLERQAERQKTLTVVDRAADDDAESVRDAQDGDIIGLNNPGAATEISYGGPNPMNHNMAIWSVQEFDEHAGGLQVLSGTSPMSETFKQDQLLHSSANALIDAMRKSIIDFINEIIYSHAWYLWTEPIRSFEVVQTVPGTSFRKPVVITPEEREGDFLQYNFKVDVYSMQNTSPQEQAAKIVSLFQNIILPSAQLAQQAGYVPNVKNILQQICELQGVPFENMYIPLDMVPQENAGQIPAPARLGGAQFKQSVSTRVSRPGATREGQINKIMSANSALMGQAS